MQVPRLFHSPTKHRIVHRPQAHRTPLDLQTVYVKEEDLQGEDGRTRISLSNWKTSGRAAMSQAKTDNVRAAQTRRLGHRRAANSFRPLASPLRPSQSKRAVAPWWPAPRNGGRRPLSDLPTRSHVGGQEGPHGIRLLEDHWLRFCRGHTPFEPPGGA
jgi:hypothetical protein